jgi:hypothetical protein
MTDYKTIRGKKIKTFATDLSDGNSAEGQIFYSDTDKEYKVTVASAAFSAGANLGTTRYSAMWAGEGTQNATLLCSGRSAAPAIVLLTEEYNGSGWSAGGNCNNGENSCAGFGTQTAAVKTGGYPGSDPDGLATESEEYDGSSWTSGNNINPGRQGHVGAGILTAGVIFGGNDGTILNKTEEYDGTNFSNVNNMNTGRQNLSGVGVQTAALAAGGGTTPVSNAAESYDGTNWTTLNNMNTARQGLGGFGNLSTAAVTGGSTGSDSNATETWDGTSWSTSPATLGTARTFFGDCGAGSSTAGVVAGGNTTAILGITEEFNVTAATVTAAAWSSGGAFPAARLDIGSFGTKNLMLAAGGQTDPAVSNKAVEYDGSSWTESGDMNTGRAFCGGFGIQTSGAVCGGKEPTTSAKTESYNGSSWTETGDLSTARGQLGAAGTLTAGIAFAGGSGSPGNTNSNSTEEFDGTSWTAGGNMNTARRSVGGSGTQTAALAGGGRSTDNTNIVEEYNGSSWSEVNDLLFASRFIHFGGTQTDTLGFGGYGSPTAPTGTQGYDGTHFSTRPSLATGAVRGGGNGGSSTDALSWAGSGGDDSNPTANQEFTSKTSGINLKTITDS